MLFLGFWEELWFGALWKITDDEQALLCQAPDKTEEQSLRSSRLTFAKRQLLLLTGGSLFVGALSNLSLYLHIYNNNNSKKRRFTNLYKADVWIWFEIWCHTDNHWHFMSRLQKNLFIKDLAVGIRDQTEDSRHCNKDTVKLLLLLSATVIISVRIMCFHPSQSLWPLIYNIHQLMQSKQQTEQLTLCCHYVFSLSWQIYIRTI